MRKLTVNERRTSDRALLPPFFPSDSLSLSLSVAISSPQFSLSLCPWRPLVDSPPPAKYWPLPFLPHQPPSLSLSLWPILLGRARTKIKEDAFSPPHARALARLRSPTGWEREVGWLLSKWVSLSSLSPPLALFLGRVLCSRWRDLRLQEQKRDSLPLPLFLLLLLLP